ncbi:MAG: MBL fold metallo-hydrolase [Planctomycetia bacterium]|nr:MBL fold metallo-hydrolase [Planctomycetia bacterium]
MGQSPIPGPRPTPLPPTLSATLTLTSLHPFATPPDPIAVDPTSLHIAVVVSKPFDQNTYIAHLPGSRSCLVVDPGFEPKPVIEHLTLHKLLPAALLVTHGHSDHIAGLTEMKARWPDCPLIIGRHDAEKLTDPWKNLSGQFGHPLVSPAADRLVDQGEVLDLAGIQLEVREIPGHSLGHVVFVWHQGRPPIVFGGDVLFAGGIGRTDFPDGSFEDLATGIHEQLFTLPHETVVLPGHGPQTTIGEELRRNPFVGRPAGFRDAD